MNRALLAKEFRDQRAYLFLGIALLVFELADAAMRQFDFLPLSTNFGEFVGAFAIFQLLLSFAIGSGLLIREIDDGTLVFLDGLPLTRQRMFFAKLATAMMILLIYPLGNVLLLAALHLVARESLDHALHPMLLVTAFGLLTVVTVVGLTLGALVGFLRNLSWLVFGIVAIVLKLLSDALPRLAVVDPTDLLTQRIIGTHWQLPMTGLLIQLSIALGCGSLALWIFCSAGAGRGRKLQLQLSRPLISATVTVLTIGVAIGLVSLYARSLSNQDTDKNKSAYAGAEFTPTAPGHSRTLHYTFSYPAQSAEQVQSLLKDADRTFNRVAALLNVSDGAAIDVDLSGSSENTEGTAFFDRIRMFPSGEQPLDTLAHETAHVLARRLAGGTNERELRKMTVFNEGLAHWVETEDATQRLSTLDRLQSAIVSHRHLVRAEQLTNMDALAREVDRNLQYPLGAVVIDSLVDRYGSDAPKQLLLTLGHADFPRDLEGMELWQTAFQLAGFDLALVFDDYARRLKEWESEFASTITALPRPRGSLLIDDEDESVGVELRMDAPLPESWRAVVRFRPKTDSPLREYAVRNVYDDVAWYSLNNVSNEQVCFQPGIRTNNVVIYEAWACLPLSSAEKYEEEPE